MNKSEFIEMQEKVGVQIQPKKEFNRYENSKLFKIINSVDDAFYIGSPCTSLAKRLSRHRSDAKRRPDVKVYKHLNKVVGLQNIKIVLIWKHYLDNKEQLLRAEDEVVQANKN